MKAHGFERRESTWNLPYPTCGLCGRSQHDRLHDPWHLRLIWHPWTFPAIIIAATIGATIGVLT